MDFLKCHETILVKPGFLKFLYVGTWLDNLRDGVGIAIYPNGDRFEGIWRRGQRNGRGRYWFANSSEQDSSVKKVLVTTPLQIGTKMNIFR